ncbi:dihydroxyacetone kinase family protein [Roseomonas sp. 18066]|uniref:dihydroxyacetone kinase family protein n=1 Tax=Roseomonas sp. 18066 TaxID=2681412 RepID=UPI0013592B34|nr:dihydroxyacetone kinase family protein [Roseomonas sp. 18066]
MKKLINDPRAVVRQMLEGLVALAPGQALLAAEDVVLRRDAGPASGRVAVLSGGGAGHEPAHAGYVGPGLLAGAVTGDVFTSPSTDAVLAGIRAAAGPEGALLVVKNYTGDRLNFGLAAELARAEGIPVEIVVVADDVALRDTVAPEKRRGIAGTVLVHKVAGAAAEAGLALAEVAAAARAAAAALGSMGVALGACTVPAAGRPGFTLEEDAVELGLGIHGEQGVQRVKLAPADDLVARILQTIQADLRLQAGARVALLVNGLGGTPPMELAIVARAALAWLRGQGIEVLRAWSGNYLTAIEMPGMSLSVMALDDARLAFLDAPASAPAWSGDGRIPEAPAIIPAPPATEEAAAAPGPLAPAMQRAVLAVCAALEAAEQELTELDSAAGDGDLGISMQRGAAALRALPAGAYASPARLLEAMAQALRRAIGGSSGPFYAVALLRAARQLEGVPAPGAAQLAEAFAAAVAAVGELGGAQAGDRTMLDALLPAAGALTAGKGLPQAVAAAEAGLEATRSMRPRQGRAAYLGERAMGTPDAGAAAVVVWLRALARA